jgi:beta-lactamase superfamily II metal-dependent hydrolase
MYKVHLLPAAFGDAILIEYGVAANPSYILIDGGPYYAFYDLWGALKKVAPELRELELLVVTHIDIDHIDGIVRLLNVDPQPIAIKEIWFNGREQLGLAAQELDPTHLGSLQGEYLTILMQQNGYLQNERFDGGPVCVRDHHAPPEVTLNGGMKITLLSPHLKQLADLIPVWDEELVDKDPAKMLEDDYRYETTLSGHVEALQELEFKPDKSPANCSSIAFLATYDYTTCLFAGDAPSDILLNTIEPLLDKRGDKKLEVNAWKLAHHGSKKSTQDSIMEKVVSKHILVSSNGVRYKHPEEPVIAKLLKHNTPEMVFHFNYRTKFNEMWDDEDLKREYAYEAKYPEDGGEGITINL